MYRNIGYQVENVVKNICANMFISDFIVTNPTYKRKDNRQNIKEACDLMVPFGNTLLVFQVKSKNEIKSVSDKNITDFARIQKKINVAISQFKAIQQALKHQLIESIINSRNITIPFKATNYTSVIGIVVLDLIGEDKFSEEEKSNIFNGFEFQYNMPIHIFLRRELEEIAQEIDTLPDFIDYLKIREKFYADKSKIRFMPEENFLVLYKYKSDLLNKFLGDEYDVILTDDLWLKDYQIRHVHALELKENINKNSYIIDNIVSQLHTGIDFDPYSNQSFRVFPSKIGNKSDYYNLITELASLTRLQRRVIGDKLVEKINLINDGNHRYSLIIDNSKGIIIMAAGYPREERAKFLSVLLHIAYCAFNLDKVIGIATEGANTELRSYDVIMIESFEFDQLQYEAAKIKAKELFDAPHIQHGSEYSNVVSIKKVGRNAICPCLSGKKFKKCCL